MSLRRPPAFTGSSGGAHAAPGGVRRGLGWPEKAKKLRESRLGWPAVVERLDGRAARVTEPAGDDVSRETPVVAAAPDTPATTLVEHTVSRETGAPAVDEPAAEAPSVLGAGPIPEQKSAETTPLAAAVEQTLALKRTLAHPAALPRPARTRVMVVANQKGGVGKTTTAVNLAAGLAQGGLRVLVIDLDPQGNASTALGVGHARGVLSSYDALVDGVPLSEVAQECAELPGVMVVPATIDLAGAEIELVSVVARENRLRKAIAAWSRTSGDSSTAEDRFDYVLVDCPPSLGLLTLNALVAAEELLLPIQAEYYALEGVGQLLETVELVRANLNPRLRISTVLLTMYDGRTRLSAAVADEVRGHFGERVLRTAIPRAVRVSEAPSYAQTVMTYDPASSGALSYREAARELAHRAEQAPAQPAGAVPAGSHGSQRSHGGTA